MVASPRTGTPLNNLSTGLVSSFLWHPVSGVTVWPAADGERPQVEGPQDLDQCLPVQQGGEFRFIAEISDQCMSPSVTGQSGCVGRVTLRNEATAGFC